MKEQNKAYKILSELGSGGMATVYKAIQKSLDRPVAIKELKKAFHADEQIVQRFEREARTSASFQHENIVHIYDYWGKPDYCIVMEYVDGTNLAEILEKSGPLPVDVGIMIALQACSALEYAHTRGFVHRDIKPGNIMIKRNGEVKLMDFGIAHTKALQSLTLPGTFLGTPAYMSPEQILGQPLDGKSDMFSFGIVLYEMFTGVKPFIEDESRSVSARILKDRPLPPRRLNSDIPWRLQRVIRKCMKKKPHRRYESMQVVARQLGKRLTGKTNKAASLKMITDYLVEANIFEAPSEQETLVTTPVRGLGFYRKLLYGSAAGLILLTAAVAYYWSTLKHVDIMHAIPAPAHSAASPITSDTVSVPAEATQPVAAPTSTATEEKKTEAKKEDTAVVKQKKTHHTR